MAEGSEVEVLLKESIRELYRVFRGYRLKTALDEHWGYRVREPVDSALRQLTVDELEQPLGHLLTTWGEVEDLKHLLPRIAELIAGERIGWMGGTYDAAVLGCFLNLGEWGRWKAGEREAVEGFLLALWEERLGNPRRVETGNDWYFSGLLLGEVLDVYGAADAPVGPALQLWERHLDARHSAMVLCEHAAGARTGMVDVREPRRVRQAPRLTVYDVSDRTGRTFADWLVSERVTGLLERTVMETKSAEVAERLSEALMWSEHLKEMRDWPQE